MPESKTPGARGVAMSTAPQTCGSSAPATDEAASPTNRFLFGKDELLTTLFPAIFDPLYERSFNRGDKKRFLCHGLVVVSGQTGSLKTEITHQLIDHYLTDHFDERAWGKPGRLPHLITLEDPIEKPLMKWDFFEKTMGVAKSRQFDFTPRQIGKDVASLEAGLLHALRQTPAVVLVGETRKKEDWAALLDFAATGHLCFTTAHAGSLVETMRKILEATEARTSDLRSSLVEKILAVVHLQKFSLAKPWREKECSQLKQELGSRETMLLPAIWRNAHGSANFFVSDGLGAILPRRQAPAADKTRPAPSCRGRGDFAGALLGLLPNEYASVREHVMRIALKADLEGI